MPKLVDHAERRTQLTEALVRVASRAGLHSVTMRSVAAEAGVSVRLVQYYFDSKVQLMHAALRMLEEQSNRRWDDRLATADRTPHAYVTQLLHEAIPDDEESRAFHLVWTSYAVLAMTDPELAAQPFVEGPNRLERGLTSFLTGASEDGALAADRDPTYEAARLLAIAHGLGTGVLVGQRTPEEARAVIAYHVRRLFPAQESVSGRR